MNFKEHCKTCPPSKHCCMFKEDIGFTFVGISNAKEIKEKIRKPYSFFLDFSPLSKETIALLKKDDPALEGHLRYTLLDKDGRLLRLKTKEDGRCILLDSGNECEIYDIRPYVCGIYPFWGIRLEDDTIKVIPHDTEPNCPILDSKYSLSQQEITLIKNIFIQIEKEAKEYLKGCKDEFILDY